jgi:hypothetical protein
MSICIGTNGVGDIGVPTKFKLAIGRSTRSCQQALFVEKTPDYLNYVILSRASQPDRARQADRVAVEQIRVRTRRAAIGVMGRRAVNRLPERAGLDFPGGQFAQKLP